MKRKSEFHLRVAGCPDLSHHFGLPKQTKPEYENTKLVLMEGRNIPSLKVFSCTHNRVNQKIYSKNH